MVKRSVLLLSGDKRQSFLKLVSGVMLMKCPYLWQTHPPWNQVGFKPPRFPRRQTGNVSHSAAFCGGKERNKGGKRPSSVSWYLLDPHPDTEVSPVKGDIFCPSSWHSEGCKSYLASFQFYLHYLFSTANPTKVQTSRLSLGNMQRISALYPLEHCEALLRIDCVLSGLVWTNTANDKL